MATATDSLKILIVDDEPAMRDLLRQSLEGAGHQIREADNGKSALSAMEKEPADLVITDLKMEGMSGNELMHTLKLAFPDTGIMLLTGHASLDTALEAMRMGALDVLQKPLNLAELEERIEKFGKEREKTRGHSGEPRKGNTTGKAQQVQKGEQAMVEVHPVELPEVEPSEVSGESDSIDKILDIPVTATVQLGKTSLPIAELLKLGSGSIVELNKRAGEPVELLVNDRLIALGEVVVVNDTFGVRVTSIVDPKQRVASLG